MVSLAYIQILLALILPALAEIAMQFTKFPRSVTAPVGDKVTFECGVKVPGERLAWRWRPDDQPDGPWREISTDDKDNMNTRLVIDVMDDTPDSSYQCVVWYGAAKLASVPARLTIARIQLQRNSREQRVVTAPLHNTVVLHCREPMSNPPADLTWWKDGGKNSRIELDTPDGVLLIRNASVEDSGTYGCVATNELSNQVLDLPEKIHLKIQHEPVGGLRFLESEDYVGTVDNDGVLTVPVRPNGVLRLWCGAVATPPPRVSWSKDGASLPRSHGHALMVNPFTPSDEGIYSCSANGIRRSWKVIALQAPRWEGTVASVNASEDTAARISCGTLHGQPAPTVQWLMNAEPVKIGKGIKSIGSDLKIDHVEKRQAGIVQCFACNQLGCVYDAAWLTVVPVQISDQDYSAEQPRTLHMQSQPPKRHNRKNPRKSAVIIAPTQPNVTRMSDESVMVSWDHSKGGLPVQFYKVQYRDVSTNSSNVQWQTASYVIPSHIRSYEIDGLMGKTCYKFRIAAVYSNQDNKAGRSSARFCLQRGVFQTPQAPEIKQATAISPTSILLNWTWSKGPGVEAEGFYVYYRAVSSAGLYEKVTAPGGVSARSIVLSHLVPDTAYEMKVQSYNAQAPSEFSTILVKKTQRSTNGASVSTEAPKDVREEAQASGALVTAGGAVGAAALLIILAVTFLLCRRAKRPPASKKGSVPENVGPNGYIPAKVPITITANPMHAEGGDGGVEMSFVHNNNSSNDDTLPHPRKNGPARQYV